MQVTTDFRHILHAKPSDQVVNPLVMVEHRCNHSYLRLHWLKRIPAIKRKARTTKHISNWNIDLWWWWWVVVVFVVTVTGRVHQYWATSSNQDDSGGTIDIHNPCT
jgi:hypothetical protein